MSINEPKPDACLYRCTRLPPPLSAMIAITPCDRIGMAERNSIRFTLLFQIGTVAGLRVDQAFAVTSYSKKLPAAVNRRCRPLAGSTVKTDD